MTLTWHAAKQKCMQWAWSQHFHRLWLGLTRMTNYDLWVARNMYTGELEQLRVWHRTLFDSDDVPHLLVSRSMWTVQVRCMLTGVCFNANICVFSGTDSRALLQIDGKL